MINLENIPVARNEDEHASLCRDIINVGGINRDEATWDGDQFIYTRQKWGNDVRRAYTPL